MKAPEIIQRIRLPAAALLFLALSQLVACAGPIGPYKAYEGEERAQTQLALLRGAFFSRQDWLNRYVDTIRFLSVDGQSIDNADSVNEILVTPGLHEITVYFSWDTGSQRGLAPALVDYAVTGEALSRTFTFNVDAGQLYHVRGNPIFAEEDTRDITGLTHVDFWVEDDFGNMVVGREQGRYVPEG
jgi:hypothetical protein